MRRFFVSFVAVQLRSFDVFPFLSDRKFRHFDRKQERDLAGCEGVEIARVASSAPSLHFDFAPSSTLSEVFIGSNNGNSLAVKITFSLSPASQSMAIWIPILSFLSSAIAIILASIVGTVISCLRRRRCAVAFFHPYTNDGGGGERVLWCAVRAVQVENPDLDCIIYTGDDASPETLTARALDRFGVHLLHPPIVVRLYKRKWVDEKSYPRFTMIGQSLGSVILSWEALCKFTPQYYFDTSGYAFTYPLARIFCCKVICYTHYPTISSDMVSRVRQHSSMYNNDVLVAKSIWLSRCKIVYYMLFSWLYGLVGSCAHLVMVNSSWTRSHIEKIWKIPARIKRVYPPCDTSALQVLPLERPSGIPILVSVAQFRPEKAHGLQLEAFALAVNSLGPDMTKPKLQFVGSCRNKEDIERLQKLKVRASELGMEKNVEFYKDVKYSELVQLLGNAIAGLHSMVDEHFGISVVEYMAAGAIPIDLEWKLIYVGSAEDEKYDQLLESVLVGPVNVGNYRFVFQADPPDPTKIREEDILGVTVLLLTCSYIGQEFIRVGYYVNNDYDDEQLREEPPTKVLIDRVQRNILADKPRVTKFPINFHPESNENGVQPAVNPSPEAINGDEEENDPELEIKVKIDAGAQPAGHPSPVANNADEPENHSALDVKKKIEV